MLRRGLKRIVVPLLAATVAGLALPAPSAAQGSLSSDRDSRIEWWREARFGLFIHWGLYAIPAGTWGAETHHGEWIQNNARIPVEEYEKLVSRFHPLAFDADAWVGLAREAGMRYVVTTTKHHDGFALFDSEHSDYDVMSTPFRRDIMKEMAEACRRQGIAIGWYHSIMDWHHPDYLPRRPWEARPAEGADFGRYVAYLRGQTRELLARYGAVDIMWYDGQWEATWTHERGQALYDLCRRLQPRVIVNNRVDKGRGPAGLTRDPDHAGDFGTPEQEVPVTGIPGADWETCMTMNTHWGYNRLDRAWKSTGQLVRTLVDVASKGGNFLLNVGPTAEGRFPEPCVERLREIGGWMRVHGEAIHGTVAGPFPELEWGRCTSRGVRDTTILYLHVFDWPEDRLLTVPGLGNDPIRAHLLEDPKTGLSWRRVAGNVQITLPGDATDPLCPVVAVEVDGVPVIYRTPVIRAPASILVDELEVSIDSRSSALELRFTLDGTEPTPRSPLYEGPFRLSATATVRARTFHRGKPVSAVAERTFEKVAPWPPLLRPPPAAPGLLCLIFEGSWDRLPEFGQLTPIARRKVNGVSLEPGPAVEYSGRSYRGYFQVSRSEVYRFALVSDDGARLWIDDRLVVDNDGLHGAVTREGTCPLASGVHRLRVDYFNRTGAAELRLLAALLDDDLEVLPAAALKH